MPPEPTESFRGYPLTQRVVEVGGRRIELIGPANCDLLVEDPRVLARFERDEYLPYWADFWPAALPLADAVAAWGPASAHPVVPTVLEIGCGLGLVSLTAVLLGYPVIASDYDDDALAFVAENARRNGLRAPQRRHVDWRRTYPDLRVDRILAAEVLYESRHLRPVANFVRNHLSPQGFALICDRNRSTADEFCAVAEDSGLTVDVQPAVRIGEPGAGDIRGRIFRLWRQAEIPRC
jgi:predicted nicotinamide N-methyase